MSQNSSSPTVATLTDELKSDQGVIISLWAIALIAVASRFLARRLVKAGLWYDDWLMIPAILVATVLSLVSAIWTANNLIKEYNWPINQLMNNTTEFNDLDNHFEEIYLEGWFISQICWVLGLWIVKCSILALYWRLFSNNGRSIQIGVWTITVVVMCWGIAVLLKTIFQCFPVDQFWKSSDSMSTQCEGSNAQDSMPVYLGGTIPHIIIDTALLIFPMPLVWNLKILKWQKIMFVAMFALGAAVTVVSGIRLGFFYIDSINNNTDSAPFLLTNVEVSTSIIAACLPSLGPIVTFISAKLAQLCKRKSTHKRGSKLLMSMLPAFAAGEPPGPPILPLTRNPSWGDGPNPMLDSVPIVEAEVEAQNPAELEADVNNSSVPELDAEAAGPYLVEIGTAVLAEEMETVEWALELES